MLTSPFRIPIVSQWKNFTASIQTTDHLTNHDVLMYGPVVWNKCFKQCMIPWNKCWVVTLIRNH